MIATTILWSYPVDFAGTRTYARKATLSIMGWSIDAIEDLALEDRAAIRIVAQLAELLLSQPWQSIRWEHMIDAIAEREVGANHQILCNK